MELDDVHTASKTHIGAVVVPAAWSLADSIGATGRQLIEAVIVGYEVMARIGEGFGVVSHRRKGWHVTGTAGTFGAAVTCAKLLGLDSKQALSSFGIAGTQSSGVWAFLGDGASCKKLHPARAAVNSLVPIINSSWHFPVEIVRPSIDPGLPMGGTKETSRCFLLWSLSLR